MRWLALILVATTLAFPVRAEDIVDVLRRSQQQRLDALQPAADGARARTVRRSFEALREALDFDVPVDLHVVTGPVIAETVHGHIIVAHESLADMPEGARLFILAHELGHVAAGHWKQVGLLYRRWVPGEVTPTATNAVAGRLGREASGLAHRHEFEADAFALQALRRLGRTPQDAFEAFLRLGVTPDTPTHPGTRKRVALLRATQLAATD